MWFICLGLNPKTTQDPLLDVYLVPSHPHFVAYVYCENMTSPLSDLIGRFRINI